MRFRIIYMILLLFVLNFSAFAEKNEWTHDLSHVYLSFFDISYAYSSDHDFGLEIGSLNLSTYPVPNKLYPGVTLIDAVVNARETEFSFFRLNLYINTLDLEYRKNYILKLFHFFYLYGYPVNFKFTYSDFSFEYKPKLVIGSELGFTQFIIPGTFGLGIEYEATNYFYYSDFNFYRDFRFKIFYKLGSLFLMS